MEKRPISPAAGMGAAALAMLAGCSQNALYATPDVTVAQLEKDRARCEELAKTLQHNPGGPIPGSPAQAVGYFIGAVVVAGIHSNQFDNLTSACLEDRGYRKLELTHEEAQRYAALKSDEEKGEFLRAMAAKPRPAKSAGEAPPRRPAGE
jgi:hypothetical protein